ncbi:unnamed protein product, partial [marine sediment metagenome]
FGSGKFTYVDEITDPMTERSLRVAREEGLLPLEAKELGPSIDVFDDTSRLSRLTLEGDEIVIRSPLDVEEGSVKFGGLWLEEGVEGVLEEGQHRYDVKGVLLDDVPNIIDDIPEFKPIEPGTGPKTPLNETFGFGQDVIQESIVKEITEGVLPITSVLTEP